MITIEFGFTKSLRGGENKNFSSRTPARREILARNGLSSLARNITARPCETLLPPNLTGPKGGLRPSKRGVEPAFWVPAASYRNNTLFLIVRTYVQIVLHLSRDQGCKTRPRSRKESHVQGLAARPNSRLLRIHLYFLLLKCVLCRLSSIVCRPSSVIRRLYLLSSHVST
jgi:hypothetical protein